MRDALTPVEVIVNRILVVEGDRDEAEFLKNFLQKHRFHVDITRDAGQARSTFNMHQPDFVILEAILPNEVSGYEVCEHLKREKNSVPVLMLTAIDMDDSRALAHRVGVDAYMTKPYDPEELLGQIRTVAESVWHRTHMGEDPQAGDSEKLRFSCTECGKHLKAKAAHRGRTLNCPRCGQAVIIPQN
ncbi:response regulator [Planctomicrobium sp. SH661]|uniref:response regulator transcription factor n=1 Tax=Planctomicrobium sp. SH661 TaxID=3448124 RepID=UPI003F5BA723